VKIIAVKVFQPKRLKRRNLKKFRLERESSHDLCDTGIAEVMGAIPETPSPETPIFIRSSNM